MNRNVPEVRFEEFTEDWKQSMFHNDILYIQTGTNLLGSDSKKGMPLIKMGNIQKGYFSLDKLEFLDANETVSELEIIKNGDFLFNTRNTLQLVGKGATWFGENNKYAFNNNIARFTFTNIDTQFFNYLYNTSGMHKQISARAVGTTSVAAIYPRDLYSVTYMIPSTKEQSRIGIFLMQIDKTIALHQQELTNLKQTKQGFLQKMFPREGETVPEVRFPGVSGEWSLIKAKDIFQSISDKNHPKLPVLSASQEKGMVFRKDIGIDISYDEKSTKNYKRVLPGQFVIHLRSFQGGFAFSKIEGITSPAYTVLDFNNPENNYSTFWKYILSSNSFIKKLEGVTYGIRDGRSISYTDFSTLKFLVPSYNEQLAIGQFLANLDRLIKIYEDELKALEQTKQAFLQKMFV